MTGVRTPVPSLCMCEFMMALPSRLPTKKKSVCLTRAILHMLRQLKVVIFLLKNINYLLKNYIFNIK